jgi:hypothetical protein
LHINRGTLSVNFGFPVIVAGLFAPAAGETFFQFLHTAFVPEISAGMNTACLSSTSNFLIFNVYTK